MLAYEPGEISRYGFSRARVRLILLRIIQNRSMRFADGVIFLTDYAARVIQRTTGALRRFAVIPHGIGAAFRNDSRSSEWPSPGGRIRCLYVSHVAMYKHQWTVVRAIAELRRRGHDVELLLAGGSSSRAQRRLDAEVASSDAEQKFVRRLGFVRHEDVPALLAGAHLFVFASSCENMPNTLLEAMTVGLPIACSNRGPMPEVLADGGLYFDPENPEEIADALETLIQRPNLRATLAERAKNLSAQYSWARCADETWKFVTAISERR
jgi:glycosyltransferase involved in cell wall biosynthesis